MTLSGNAFAAKAILRVRLSVSLAVSFQNFYYSVNFYSQI